MKKTIIITSSLLVALLIGMAVVRYQITKKEGQPTDTLIVVDTVRYMVPVATDSVTVKYVTRWLKATPTADAVGTGTLNPKHDTLGITYEDMGDELAMANDEPPDSSQYVEVEIPIEQKRYDTEDYTAWVSGYEPKLDSINIYRQKQIVTTTIYKEKTSRFACVAGVGAGINSKAKVEPFVGITIGYKLF